MSSETEKSSDKRQVNSMSDERKKCRNFNFFCLPYFFLHEDELDHRSPTIRQIRFIVQAAGAIHSSVTV